MFIEIHSLPTAFSDLQRPGEDRASRVSDSRDFFGIHIGLKSAEMTVVFSKPRTVRIERKKRKARLRWIVSRLSQDPNTGIFGLSPIGF